MNAPERSDLAVLSSSVKRVREGLGWSQRDLAKHIGVHPDTVMYFESGRRVPHAANTEAFLQFVQDYEELLPDTKDEDMTVLLLVMARELAREASGASDPHLAAMGRAYLRVATEQRT